MTTRYKMSYIVHDRHCLPRVSAVAVKEAFLRNFSNFLFVSLYNHNGSSSFRGSECQCYA